MNSPTQLSRESSSSSDSPDFWLRERLPFEEMCAFIIIVVIIIIIIIIILLLFCYYQRFIIITIILLFCYYYQRFIIIHCFTAFVARIFADMAADSARDTSLITYNHKSTFASDFNLQSCL